MPPATSPSPPAPTRLAPIAEPVRPERIGPWQIRSELGRGGMGVVYEAVHETTGQRVALKTLVAVDPHVAGNIRREMRALARLSHPGIVRIEGDGLEGGVPWYAMELLEGTSLRAFLGTLWPGLEASHKTPTSEPEPMAAPSSTRVAAPDVRPVAAGGRLPEALGIVHGLCRALAYMHGRGIVHRDLKPDNILVTVHGPVLVDFGLSARFASAGGRDDLDVDAIVMATPAYAAPEHLRGELVDARADLYSLGCILYELVTGRGPIRASETIAASFHTAAEAILPPSTIVEGVEPALDLLLLRMLAVKPEERIGYADDVASALEGLGAAVLPSPPQPVSYLYRPRLTGRHDVLRTISRHVEEIEKVPEGAGRLVVISGPSGIGKTRLAMEVATLARQRGFQIFTGAAGGDAGTPLLLFRDLIQAAADRCRELDGTPIARALAVPGKVLAPYEPSIAGVPAVARLPEPPPLPPSAAVLRIAAALAETMEQLSKDGPLLAVLDNLQHADDLSATFLDFLVRSERLGSMPVLIIGTHIPEEEEDAAASLLTSPFVEQLELGPLRTEAVASLVREMLGDKRPPNSLVEALERESEGNPFFVSEYLRSAVDAGVLHRDGHGVWRIRPDVESRIPLPRSLRELLARRLDQLGAGARGLLELLTVIGGNVEPDIVSEVATATGDEVLEPLTELLERNLVEIGDDGLFRLVHARFGETAHHGMDPSRKQRLHRAAAETFDARLDRGSESAEIHGKLGLHWELGGDPARARRSYDLAAKIEFARHAVGESARLHRAYLALVEEESPESINVRNGYAKVLVRQGRSEEAQAENERALADATRLGDAVGRATALSGLAIVHHQRGRSQEARRLYLEVLQHARVARDLELTGLTLQHLGVVAQASGSVDEARAYYEASLVSIAPDRRAMTLANYATLHNQQRRFADAERLYRESIDAAHEAGNAHVEAMSLMNLATMRHELGELDEALTNYERAHAIARQSGNRPVEGLCLGNLAMCLQQIGSHADAERKAREALVIARDAGDARSVAGIKAQLAELHLEQGRIDEALRGADEVRALVSGLPDPRLRAVTTAALATIYRRGRNEIETPRLLLDEAATILEGVRDTLELAKCLCHRGHVALAAGESATGFLVRARQLAATLELARGSELNTLLSRLTRAIAGAAAGERLVRGEALETLPAALRRQLRPPTETP